MLPEIDTQDELLIAVALCHYSYRVESAFPIKSARAWEICQQIADVHGLEPSEIVLQLESSHWNSH